MLNSRKFRNTLTLREGADPTERRENLTKEILKNSTSFPRSLAYEDIDEGMKEWSDTVLDLSFEGKKLPTIALYTNQRFEEYMQSWQHTDNKKNFLMNFKTLTRENNPKKGTMNGSSSNIPGNRYYLMRRDKIIDKNGQESYIEYQMKQPIAVDLVYSIGVVTSKFELINEFNTLLQTIFKSGYNYLNINGHYIYIKLEDTSDSSEYAIDDRRYFSQTAKFTVKGYIIQEEDFRVEEKPTVKFLYFEGEPLSNAMEAFSDDDAVVECGGIYYKPLTIKITHRTSDKSEFHTRLPYNMVVKKTVTENIKTMCISIEGDPVDDANNFEFISGGRTNFKIYLENKLSDGSITFYGYDKDTILDDSAEY